MCKFRLLTADEIECRIGMSKEKGVSLLLYKDARCDMSILDETVGAENWQRRHEFKDGKLYCTVSLFNKERQEWVSKEDVGTESNTEAEKGQASDAFKRACVNWGIGRELYTSPFIWIPANANEDLKKTKFFVKTIEYDDKRRISHLVIIDESKRLRFEYPKRQTRPTTVAEYTGIATPDSKDVVKKITDMVAASKSIKDLMLIWTTYPDYQSHPLVKSEFSKRKKEINDGSAA